MDGINTTHWRSLGLDLGLPLSQINEIDDKGGWSENMMIDILSLWLRGNGKPATIDSLVTAVKDLPNIGLAEQLVGDKELCEYEIICIASSIISTLLWPVGPSL